MSNQWQSYLTRIGDQPGSVRIDFTFTNPEFRPDFLTTMLYVWVKLQNPDTNGLTTAAEAEQLDPIEDGLVELLGAEYGAVPVGVVTTSGRREFYFYAESGDNLHEELAPLLAANPDYAIQFGDKSDPEWQHYFGYLFPSPTEYQWIIDRQIVTQLQDHNDPLTPRPVQHWLYFRTPESREQVKQQLLSQGFTLDSEPDGEQAYGLVVIRTDAVDLPSIHEVTVALTQLASAHEGQYDGWETQVISS
ncbi:DUF695 domain-containing protein [Tumebacillus permanentifrigoris]|uniref:Regulator of ribonuclease activity B n=1 Tax=Tumebacillus permanentifrigoris TaxID=378543 RepID=A0A316D499_9BACL|nr:DUF695 domain-containing protein [Tumebacillus permanentifrigoris]PWK05018.1 regulator of ribonuclease activity B [Tumebacillus permanentifrigoris]